jgi:ribosomal protein S18 acetylase RimI-like enzyme
VANRFLGRIVSGLAEVRGVVTIRPVSVEDAARLKAVRLEALRESPAAFGSTYAAESQLAESVWRTRATPDAGGRSITFLAYDGEIPCGIVRGWLDDRVEATAFVQSMWVAPGWRRLGVGRSWSRLWWIGRAGEACGRSN